MKKWKNGALLLLCLALFFTLFYNALKSRHLFSWDDRFHALVAANLAEEAAMPKLYPERALKPYDHGPWYRSYYWVHKPPFFSYQAALTLRFLGNELWVYRLNGALLHLLWFSALFFLLRVWRLPAWPSFLLAALTVSSRFIFFLANGKMGMDQNDLSFLLYLSLATLLFSLALQDQRRFRWWLLLGSLGMAAAVLTKFLTGFLPFLFLLLMAAPQPHWRRRWPYLLASALLPLGAAAAWYAYAYQWAPQVTVEELTYNGRHFWETLEGHAHPWYYILSRFGEAFAALMVSGVVLLALYWWSRRGNRSSGKIQSPLLRAAGGSALFALLFFSLAQTKLPAYGYIAVIYLLLVLAAAWPGLATQGKNILTVLMLLLLLPQLAAPYTWRLNDPLETCRAEYFRRLRDTLPKKAVLFKAKPLAYPEIMFYSQRLAYDRHPNEFELRSAVEQGYQPYFLSYGRQKIALQPLEKELGVQVLAMTCAEP